MTPTEEIQAIKDATKIPVAFLASLSGINAQRLHNIINPEHRARATPDELHKVKVALLTLVERIQALAVEPIYPRMESDGQIAMTGHPASIIPAGLSEPAGSDGSTRFK